MSKILEINNLTFSYNNNQKLFKNFDISFNQEINIIVGTPCSGKTTLFNILNGSILTDSLSIDGKKITKKSVNDVYRTVGVISNNYSFIINDIYSELSFALENNSLKNQDISKHIKDICDTFNLSDKLSTSIDCLSAQDQLMIYIASYLISDIKVLLIDECFNMLSTTNKKIILDYALDKSIQVIVLTSNIEDALFAKYVYILNEGKIVLEGKKQAVLKEEKILKRLGLSLPIIVDISAQLNSYKVINKMFYDAESLGEEIWQ